MKFQQKLSLGLAVLYLSGQFAPFALAAPDLISKVGAGASRIPLAAMSFDAPGFGELGDAINLATGNVFLQVGELNWNNQTNTKVNGTTVDSLDLLKSGYGWNHNPRLRLTLGDGQAFTRFQNLLDPLVLNNANTRTLYLDSGAGDRTAFKYQDPATLGEVPSWIERYKNLDATSVKYYRIEQLNPTEAYQEEWIVVVKVLEGSTPRVVAHHYSPEGNRSTFYKDGAYIDYQQSLDQQYAGATASTQDPDGILGVAPRTQITYSDLDAQSQSTTGRISKVIDAQNRTVDYVWENNQRIKTINYPGSRTVEFLYSGDNLTTVIFKAKSSASSTQDLSRTYKFDYYLVNDTYPGSTTRYNQVLLKSVEREITTSGGTNTASGGTNIAPSTWTNSSAYLKTTYTYQLVNSLPYIKTVETPGEATINYDFKSTVTLTDGSTGSTVKVTQGIKESTYEYDQAGRLVHREEKVTATPSLFPGKYPTFADRYLKWDYRYYKNGLLALTLEPSEDAHYRKATHLIYDSRGRLVRTEVFKENPYDPRYQAKVKLIIDSAARQEYGYGEVLAIKALTVNDAKGVDARLSVLNAPDLTNAALLKDGICSPVRGQDPSYKLCGYTGLPVIKETTPAGTPAQLREYSVDPANGTTNNQSEVVIGTGDGKLPPKGTYRVSFDGKADQNFPVVFGMQDTGGTQVTLTPEWRTYSTTFNFQDQHTLKRFFQVVETSSTLTRWYLRNIHVDYLGADLGNTSSDLFSNFVPSQDLSVSGWYPNLLKPSLRFTQESDGTLVNTLSSADFKNAPNYDATNPSHSAYPNRSGIYMVYGNTTPPYVRPGYYELSFEGKLADTAKVNTMDFSYQFVTAQNLLRTQALTKNWQKYGEVVNVTGPYTSYGFFFSVFENVASNPEWMLKNIKVRYLGTYPSAQTNLLPGPDLTSSSFSGALGTSKPLIVTSTTDMGLVNNLAPADNTARNQSGVSYQVKTDYNAVSGTSAIQPGWYRIGFNARVNSMDASKTLEVFYGPTAELIRSASLNNNWQYFTGEFQLNNTIKSSSILQIFEETASNPSWQLANISVEYLGAQGVQNLLPTNDLTSPLFLGTDAQAKDVQGTNTPQYGKIYTLNNSGLRFQNPTKRYPGRYRVSFDAKTTTAGNSTNVKYGLSSDLNKSQAVTDTWSRLSSVFEVGQETEYPKASTIGQAVPTFADTGVFWMQKDTATPLQVANVTVEYLDGDVLLVPLPKQRWTGFNYVAQSLSRTDQQKTLPITVPSPISGITAQLVDTQNMLAGFDLRTSAWETDDTTTISGVRKAQMPTYGFNTLFNGNAWQIRPNAGYRMRMGGILSAGRYRLTFDARTGSGQNTLYFRLGRGATANTTFNITSTRQTFTYDFVFSSPVDTQGSILAFDTQGGNSWLLGDPKLQYLGATTDGTFNTTPKEVVVYVVPSGIEGMFNPKVKLKASLGIRNNLDASNKAFNLTTMDPQITWTASGAPGGTITSTGSETTFVPAPWSSALAGKDVIYNVTANTGHADAAEDVVNVRAKYMAMTAVTPEYYRGSNNYWTCDSWFLWWCTSGSTKINLRVFKHKLDIRNQLPTWLPKISYRSSISKANFGFQSKGSGCFVIPNPSEYPNVDIWVKLENSNPPLEIKLGPPTAAQTAKVSDTYGEGEEGNCSTSSTLQTGVAMVYDELQPYPLSDILVFTSDGSGGGTIQPASTGSCIAQAPRPMLIASRKPSSRLLMAVGSGITIPGPGDGTGGCGSGDVYMKEESTSSSLGFSNQLALATQGGLRGSSVYVAPVTPVTTDRTLQWDTLADFSAEPRTDYEQLNISNYDADGKLLYSWRPEQADGTESSQGVATTHHYGYAETTVQNQWFRKVSGSVSAERWNYTLASMKGLNFSSADPSVLGIANNNAVRSYVKTTFNDAGLVSQIVKASSNPDGIRTSTQDFVYFDNNVPTSNMYTNWIKTSTVKAVGVGDLVTQYEYDALGNIIKETEEKALNSKVAVTTGEDVTVNVVTTRKFNGFGQKEQESLYTGDSLTADAAWVYSSNGTPIRSWTGTDKNLVYYHYNANGQNDITAAGTPSTVRTVITRTFDLFGNTTTQETNGFKASTTYDSLDRPIEEKNPDGGGFITTYDAYGKENFKGMIDTSAKVLKSTSTFRDVFGFVVAETTKRYDPRASTDHDATVDSTYLLDGYGRPIQESTVADGETLITQYAYDAVGNLRAKLSPQVHVSGTSSLKDERRPVMETLYDGANRIYKQRILLEGSGIQAANIIQANLDTPTQSVFQGTGTDVQWAETRFVYDHLGRQVSSVDPNGYITSTYYDLRDNIVRQDRQVWLATHNASDGYMPTGQSASTRVVSYQGYDASGHVLVTKDPLGYRATKVYDLLGNLIEERNHSNALMASYTYTEDGLQIAKFMPSPTLSSPPTTATTTSSTGQIINNMVAVEAKEYGSSPLPVKTIVPTSTSPLSVSGTTVSGGTATTYTYNHAGLPLTTSTTADGKTTTVTQTYDAFGNNISTINADGFKTTSIYDADGKMLEKKEWAREGSTIDSSAGLSAGFNYKYQYDALGRLTSKVERGLVVKYEYNNLGKVVAETRAVRTTSTVVPPRKYTYYRLDGNKTAETSYGAVVTGTTGNVPSGVSSGNLTKYVLDATGNIITETSVGTRYALGSTTNDGIQQKEYTSNQVYNGLGLRVKRSFEGDADIYVGQQDDFGKKSRTLITVDGNPFTQYDTFWVYDVRGQLKEKWDQVPVTDSAQITKRNYFKYSYNENGQETRNEHDLSVILFNPSAGVNKELSNTAVLLAGTKGSVDTLYNARGQIRQTTVFDRSPKGLDSTATTIDGLYETAGIYNLTTYSFNGDGSLSKLEVKRGNSLSALALVGTKTFQYDGRGREIQQVDSNGSQMKATAIDRYNNAAYVTGQLVDTISPVQSGMWGNKEITITTQYNEGGATSIIATGKDINSFKVTSIPAVGGLISEIRQDWRYGDESEGTRKYFKYDSETGSIKDEVSQSLIGTKYYYSYCLYKYNFETKTLECETNYYNAPKYGFWANRKEYNYDDYNQSNSNFVTKGEKFDISYYENTNLPQNFDDIVTFINNNNSKAENKRKEFKTYFTQEGYVAQEEQPYSRDEKITDNKKYGLDSRGNRINFYSNDNAGFIKQYDADQKMSSFSLQKGSITYWNQFIHDPFGNMVMNSSGGIKQSPEGAPSPQHYVIRDFTSIHYSGNEPQFSRHREGEIGSKYNPEAIKHYFLWFFTGFEGAVEFKDTYSKPGENNQQFKDALYSLADSRTDVVAWSGVVPFDADTKTTDDLRLPASITDEIAPLELIEPSAPRLENPSDDLTSPASGGMATQGQVVGTSGEMDNSGFGIRIVGTLGTPGDAPDGNLESGIEPHPQTESGFGVRFDTLTRTPSASVEQDRLPDSVTGTGIEQLTVETDPSWNFGEDDTELKPPVDTGAPDLGTTPSEDTSALLPPKGGEGDMDLPDPGVPGASDGISGLLPPGELEPDLSINLLGLNAQQQQLYDFLNLFKIKDTIIMDYLNLLTKMESGKGFSDSEAARSGEVMAAILIGLSQDKSTAVSMVLATRQINNFTNLFEDPNERVGFNLTLINGVISGKLTPYFVESLGSQSSDAHALFFPLGYSGYKWMAKNLWPSTLFKNAIFGSTKQGIIDQLVYYSTCTVICSSETIHSHMPPEMQEVVDMLDVFGATSLLMAAGKSTMASLKGILDDANPFDIVYVTRQNLHSLGSLGAQRVRVITRDGAPSGAKALYDQAKYLEELLPAGKARNGTTVVVVRFINAEANKSKTLIFINSPASTGNIKSMPKQWRSLGFGKFDYGGDDAGKTLGQISGDVIWVGQHGMKTGVDTHAEDVFRQFLESGAAKGWYPVEGGVSKNICQWKGCDKVIGGLTVDGRNFEFWGDGFNKGNIPSKPTTTYRGFYLPKK
ncbi:RHS repeat protein [Deinococcus cellulosilyticus]|uniref:Uncharacterized protein n=1 Tax=Deinococcus cellulosilyticus (strain DSM 18568 / NBRC 106333 / KACC 11606 / 5516J-15) TaxID=1223518 RepID=A0A511NBB3_DEIC1|nr:RHS repeat protein [Deinococcus cellulosilyticus]GEM50063.1 hypothetical protein DC3_56980 [Deinococcus cellulosilyticus NBRC 106333 = KACC 11606]